MDDLSLNQPLQTCKQEYAGIGNRVAAFVIDMAVYRIFSSSLLGLWFNLKELPDNVSSVLATVLMLLVYWLYFAGMESSKHQATLGMWLLHIKVTDTSNNRLTFTKASVRAWGRIVSLLVFGIGVLMIIFTEKKQGLHDMMAEVIVVKTINPAKL